jgi:hypothetical protein
MEEAQKPICVSRTLHTHFPNLLRAGQFPEVDSRHDVHVLDELENPGPGDFASVLRIQSIEEFFYR